MIDTRSVPDLKMFD